MSEGFRERVKKVEELLKLRRVFREARGEEKHEETKVRRNLKVHGGEDC